MSKRKKTKSSKIYSEGDIKYIRDYERETPPFMTKLERARILGIRAEQLSKGAVSIFSLKELEVLKEKNPYISSLYIATKELKERKMPLFIRRYLPNGTYEDWKIKDFIH